MSRHLGVLISSWRAESRRRKENRRKRVEREFLPAALEIMDTPPRPLGRIILWTIILATALALTWATLAKVDIVAVAEGRVIPRGKLQSIEAAENGVVRAILVTEGERVEAGQPLIELDPTFADADAEAARSELATARLQKRRAEALLAYAEGEPWQFTPSGEIAAGVAAAEDALVRARIQEYEARVASLDQRLSGARYAERQAEAELDRLNATLPMVRQQLEQRRTLANEGFAPRIQVEELEERATSLRFQARAAAAEIDKAAAEAAMIARDRTAEREAFRARAATELSEAESIIATRSEIVEKAERRTALQTLTAPVTGTINEINLTTIGEVAQPGEPLITLVPEGDELIIEAFILNKDVGFVKSGQSVTIKLEAYPFMRYGYLEGEVENVSADSVIDQARGLVFPGRVRVTGDRFNAAAFGGIAAEATADTLLATGMTSSVEIKTGRRSVLSFLLSPIARSVSEAGRER